MMTASVIAMGFQVAAFNAAAVGLAGPVGIAAISSYGLFVSWNVFNNDQKIQKEQALLDLANKNVPMLTQGDVSTQEGGADAADIQWCTFPPTLTGQAAAIRVLVRFQEDRFVAIEPEDNQKTHFDLSFGQFFPFAKVRDCKPGSVVPVHITGSGMSRNEVVDVEVVQEPGVMRVRLPLDKPMPLRHRCEC